MEAPSIAGTFFVKYYALHTAEYVACSRLSVSGVDAKENDTPRWGGGGRGGGREKGKGSFLTFYLRVRAFSIQRTRLSRSLEHATEYAMDFVAF